MSYRFRFRFAAKTPGTLPFDADTTSIKLADGLVVDLVARNADTAAGATAFNFEAGGFETEQAAHDAGERLRTRLRLLNAILDLGINVPATDKTSTNASQTLKDSVEKPYGVQIMDSVWGWPSSRTTAGMPNCR